MNVVCNGIIDRLERLDQRDGQNERRPNRRDRVPLVVESDEYEVDNYDFEVESYYEATTLPFTVYGVLSSSV